YGTLYPTLEHGPAAEIAEQVQRTLKTNRYDQRSDTLRFSPGEGVAFAPQGSEWSEYFSGKAPAPGLPSSYIKRPDELAALAAYFAWATWASVAQRPGKDYSYTNNWPYEPLAGNVPSASTYLWSGLSLITLLGALGFVLFAFGKFQYLGWKGEGEPHTHENRMLAWSITPSHGATGLFLVVVAVLFLLQTLAGGALAHYRVEPGGFYGFDLSRWLPYNLLRTWHLQLAIFWMATAWVAGGLFLAPLV